MRRGPPHSLAPLAVSARSRLLLEICQRLSLRRAPCHSSKLAHRSEQASQSSSAMAIASTSPAASVAELFRQRFRREVRQGFYVLHFAYSAGEALHMLGEGVRPELIVTPLRYQ